VEHRIDAALCQHLLRTGQVPVRALVSCADSQRAAREAGASVPFLWELLKARNTLSSEALFAARRAVGDPFARAPAAVRDAHASATVQPRSPEEPDLRQSGEFLPSWGSREREGVGPGDVLGDYKIERPIGRGSMGSVFSAHDQRCGRRVAVKILAGERARGGSGASRFHHEARLLCSLRHPNLVRGLGFGTQQGRAFLAMELVEGPSLKHVVGERGPLPSEEVAGVGIGLAQVLSYLHSEGVVHRDVKPANVLVDSEGRPRLCDLGLARDSICPSEATSSGDTLGTPCYMAPEQARGASSAGPSADLYSLGVTLFHAAAGRPPFEGDSGIVVLSRHLFDGVPDVRTVRPDVDPRLARAIWRLTRMQPSQRYGSARELRRALAGVTSEVCGPSAQRLAA
jgi:serine/threonine protein kinase